MAKAKTKSAAVDLSKGPKKGEKTGYTKAKLYAYLAHAIAAKGVPEISRKQAAAVVETLVDTLFAYAPVGAKLPGLGKLVLREVKARPERKGINPKTGEEITIPAKPKSQKLVFRFERKAKERINKK
ncbi:MAG: HU family DNA-binding protein [Planctomycetota bacterium]|nr:HU family DNA-binding protein [Planctomycetota bacterium]MDW8372319.1 HU family DNA-binding protein [Planctomycetota bacterium]